MTELPLSYKVIQLQIDTINTVMQKYILAYMLLNYSDLVKYGYNKTGKKDFSEKEIFLFGDQITW